MIKATREGIRGLSFFKMFLLLIQQPVENTL
jgi:hypothetical protein